MVGVDSLTYVGNHGLERLAPGADEPALDPALEPLAERVRRVRGRALHDRSCEQLGVTLEDKDAIWSFHYRGAPDEDGGPRGARGGRRSGRAGAGSYPHWGRKVLEIRPTAAVDKGTAVAGRARRARARARALRRRRHDRPGRVPAAARAGRRRARSTARSAWASRRPRAPAAVVDEADLVVEGTEGFLRAARDALAARAPLALHRLPQVDRAAGCRGGDGARGRHDRGRPPPRTTPTTIIFALAWWVVAAADRRLARPPRRDDDGDRPAAGRRAHVEHAARDPAGRGAAQPAVAAGACRPCWPPACRGSSRSSRRWWPAARSWSRSRGASRSAAVTAIEERDGVRFYVVPELAVRRDRADAHAGPAAASTSVNGAGS